MMLRCGACSPPADEGQVLAGSDSWRFDAFADAAGGGRCPASTLRAVRLLVEIGLLEKKSGLATTSFAAMSDAVLACCHRSRCSSAVSAGNYLHRGIVGLVLLAG